MSFGRYHTGIGYYNRAFHSGTWLQTTADRPLVMEFAHDGGVLPTQAVGLSFTGSIPSGRLGLNYIAEYGSSDTHLQNLAEAGIDDEDNGNHVNVGLFARPESIPGLQIGGALYYNRISERRHRPHTRVGQANVHRHIVLIPDGEQIPAQRGLIHDASG